MYTSRILFYRVAVAQEICCAGYSLFVVSVGFYPVSTLYIYIYIYGYDS